MKVRRDEGVGRILVGDNKGGVAAVLWPIMLHCLGVQISVGFPYTVHIHYSWPCVYSATCYKKFKLNRTSRNVNTGKTGSVVAGNISN